MFCIKCGAEIGDNVKFCPNCGEPVAAVPSAEDKPKRKTRKSAVKTAKEDVKISDDITLCSDGKYRWVYEMSLFKNPTVFLLIAKILLFAFLAIFCVTTVADAVRFGVNEKLIGNIRVCGIVFLVIFGMFILAYLIYAAIMGGKYVVEFEMDEKGVNHSQISYQAKKANKIARAAMTAGAASGRIGTVGVGMNAQRTEMYSDFEKTKKIKAYPRRHLIKVNGMLSHNQVYTAKEDFEFVLDFIVSHCPNAKRK